MISFISGRFALKEPTHVVMETHGVGYEIKISLSTFSALPKGEEGKLFTHLHIKEDAHTLYGFSTTREKAVFLQLISISGVGPNTALMVLSSLSSEELRSAIVTENAKVIQGVKGIGAKTAQRIILELKDKMAKESDAANVGSFSSPSHNTAAAEALSALVTLGIPRATAQKNLDTIIKKDGNGLTVEELIKKALRSA